MNELSLNEITALGTKAARGGGMSWGQAEDAGQALRWLHACGFPGAEALVGYLTAREALSGKDLIPTCATNIWAAGRAGTCPITCGAAICDRTQALRAFDALSLNQVHNPLLLLPFISWLGRDATVSWDRNSIGLSDGTWAGTLDEEYSAHSGAADVTIIFGPVIGELHTAQSRAFIAAADLHALSQFAHRTYAPATAESRNKGAGAGLTDND